MLAVLFVNGDLQLALTDLGLAGLEPRRLGQCGFVEGGGVHPQWSPWLSDRIRAVTNALPVFAVRVTGSRCNVPVIKM
jgi:hypothetical protein